MDEQQPTKDNKKPSASYGGRSKKQWVIIYLVVAIVVYAIIYFVWIKKDNPTSSGGLY